MKKRWIAITAFVAVVAVLAWAFHAGKITLPFGGDSGKKNSVTVGTSGGTFTFSDGLVVTVPKGAVDDGTTLSATTPVSLRKQDSGPFNGIRSAGVKFDISLAKGDKRDIQPKKPLEVDIPLKGKYLPDDADHTRALLYTPGVGGAGYELVPTVSRRNVLHGWLAHLSPKYVAYVSDQALLDSFYPKKAEEERGNCKQQITISGQKVKIGGSSHGWSLNDNSPIFACLYTSDGDVRVGISNRIDYILSVATTSNVRLVASKGDAEEEIVKAFSSTLFPNYKIKAYAGRNGKLVGSMDVNNLPGTIELVGDPNTFLAEGAWRAIGVIAGVFIGKDSSGTAQVVKQIIESADVVSCLQDHLNPDGGGLSFGNVSDFVLHCTTPIVDALAKHISPFELIKRVQEVDGLLHEIFDTITTAANGIHLQVNNTMRVEVVSDAPQCPTDEQIDAEVRASSFVRSASSESITEVQRQTPVVCQDGWAVASIGVMYTDSVGLIGFSGVFHLIQGRWTLVDAGQDMRGHPSCSQAPQKIVAELAC